ncbi:MAG: hypothetical protein ACK500_14390 [Flavobacteriales bacterium]|jgi:hypothetical protein
MNHTVRRTLIVGFVSVLSVCASAQFEGIEVEQVDNATAVPGRTYRFYVKLANDSDQVHMVYGDAKHALEIKSTKPFYQSPEGGPFSTQINRKRAADVPVVRFDSWLTIGAMDNYDNETTNFLLKTDDFETAGGSIHTTDGAWFCIPGKSQTYAGSDRRVLIAQLTTEGVISGKVSIMGRTAKGEVFHAYDVELKAGKK